MKAIDYLAQGLTASEIVKKLGISKQAVYQQLRKLEIPVSKIWTQEERRLYFFIRDYKKKIKRYPYNGEMALSLLTTTSNISRLIKSLSEKGYILRSWGKILNLIDHRMIWKHNGFGG